MRKIRLRPVRLKDFQLATVDYAFRRLYDDADKVDRFLIADEVGLGKTLCARGLIARTIERLQQEGVSRIDIVYVCSNGDIAQQNVRRLNVTDREDFHLARRITLLPLHMHALARNPLNFVSFTPGTSLDLKSATGTVEERAVLYWLLRGAWGAPSVSGVGARRLLAVSASVDSLDWWIKETKGRLDRDLTQAFARELERRDRRAKGNETGLRDRFTELRRRFGARRHLRDCDRQDQRQIIGELRDILASVCVNALEPDLIILDEFQRFKHLLDPNSAAGELAQQLFRYEGAKVVLLSATPYKMYTVAEDVNDDHYADFFETLKFLLGEGETQAFRQDLAAYREALLQPDAAGILEARDLKGAVERRLRRVMARTERLASTPDRNGMLIERSCNALTIELADLRSYVALDALSSRLGTGDVLEYWKSTPYVLNFMEDYKLSKAIDAKGGNGVPRREVTRRLKDVGTLSWEAFEEFRPLNPGNPRMRSLHSDVIESDAWKLLWIPPSLPYYEPGPPFNDPRLSGLTKRLVFSSWTVVPKAIASMLSYEAECRMMTARRGSRINSPEEREKIKPLLRFARSRGRLTGMPVLALLYPSPALARLADPRDIAGVVGGDGTVPARADIVRVARDRIVRAIEPLLRKDETGAVDERWYWAGPLLLDQAVSDAQDDWLNRDGLADAWTGVSDDHLERSALQAHIDEAAELARADDPPSLLGRQPDDLADVLTELALAGPAVCALRALSRVVGGESALSKVETRDGAAHVAWGLRSLFNTPEVTMLVRGRSRQAYWRRVLGYCAAGGLQAVLDEYAHVLVDWLGLADREAAAVAAGVADAMYGALSLRRVTYAARDLRSRERDGRFGRRRMPGRFALRFTDERGDDGKALNRRASVHSAFNSPFWPFVLATTSVGQEGLDFHLYCHAVVHWNLPANPVDLEQREGRVHRYKGHAVRKNLGSACRAGAFSGADPWAALFEEGERLRPLGQSDIIPSWVFAPPDGARIERYVPALPLSRDRAQLADLKRGLAVYRLAFGQPRQEDLVEFLRQRFSEEQITQLLEEFKIDLAPMP